MALPSLPHPTDTVDFGGESITVRGLTRGEAQALAEMDWDAEAPEVEVHLTAYGLGEAVTDEFRAWYAGLPVKAVKPIVDKVLELSGLRDDIPKGSSAN
jgi:hypothetical protein